MAMLFLVYFGLTCFAAVAKCDDEFAVNEGKILHGQNKFDHVGHGDIMFKPGQEEAIFGEASNVKKNVKTDLGSRWPLPIAYEIADGIDSKTKEAIREAIEEIESKTCVRFRPKTSKDTSFVSIESKEGCWSYVGKTEVGRQVVSLSSGNCFMRDTAIHELLHLLGFYHEQSRPDRDSFVKVNKENILDGKISQFDVESTGVTTYGQNYDFKSILHYRKFAFSKNRKATIEKRGDPSAILGSNNKGLSPIDIKKISFTYCQSPSKNYLMNSEIVTAIIKDFMDIKGKQSNSVLTQQLSKKLTSTFKGHKFTVSAYNEDCGYVYCSHLDSKRHAFIGICGHVFNKQNKYVIACYVEETASVPNIQQKTNVKTAIANLVGNNLDCQGASTVRDKVKSKIISLGVRAAVQVVEDGLDLQVVSNGSFLEIEYSCKSCKKIAFWNKCSNKKFKIITTFGAL